VNNNDLDAAFARYKSIAAAPAMSPGPKPPTKRRTSAFCNSDTADAEKEVFALVKQFPSHDHWKARPSFCWGCLRRHE
jgi:hypothetical protein